MGFADIKGKGDFDYLAQFSLDHGFGLVQISLDNPLYFPERYDSRRREEIARQFKSQGIGLCFHGPSDIPLMNRHERIRLAGLERLFEMLQMAIDMGGEYFIFHPGRLAFYSISTRKVFFMEQKYPAKLRDLLTDSLRRLLERSAGKIKLCLEITDTVAALFLKAVSEMVRKNGLYLVWDVGHTELTEGDKRQQLLRFFQDNVKYVKLAHLHDIRDGADHKTLGSGTLNIAGYLEIFNAMAVDMIIEVFPERELLKSADYLRNVALMHKTK